MKQTDKKNSTAGNITVREIRFNIKERAITEQQNSPANSPIEARGV